MCTLESCKKEARIIIAIDGPSGAGKSTLAKKLARELGLTYMDTGAMYRAFALKLIQEGIDPQNGEELTKALRGTTIDLSEEEGQLRVLLDGADVTRQIRTPEVSQMASRVSALRVVRERMLELQRALGSRGGVVAEGRDIGTVVFPQAEVKIYLDASARERARRRFEELRASGRSVSLKETLREMEERDKRDSERALAPLSKADGAIVIDSSSRKADEVAAEVIRVIKSKWLKN